MTHYEPLARYAALSGFMELCTQLDINPYTLFSQCQLDITGLITYQDHWVPAIKIIEVLELAAHISGKDNFGMRLAAFRRFSQLGYLSLVIREEPNLHHVITTLMRYNRLYNEATNINLSHREDSTIIQITLDASPAQSARQAIELTVGTLMKLMRDTCGDNWEPRAIYFTHTKPSDISIHTQILGARIMFQQKINAIVIRTSDLNRKNILADPVLYQYTQQLLSGMEHNSEISIVQRTQELIEAYLPAGHCSIQHIAQSLGMTRRTLHRQLSQQNTSFTQILHKSRKAMAAQLMRNKTNSLSEIAELLAFSSQSNFTRWFRQSFGVSPKQWHNSAHIQLNSEE